MVRRKGRGSRAGVRRGELTSEELERTGQVAGEGFTVRTAGRGAGRPARNVFSTGFAPDLGRSAEVNIDPTKPASEQIGEFNKARISDLSAPGANIGIGGWQDPATGSVGQDASVLTPRTREGLAAAMYIGTEGGQQAIGNLGYRSYIGDVTIPEHLQKGQFVWHETGGIDPKVEDVRIHEVDSEGNSSPKTIVRITPSRKEMVGVEAGLMAEKLKLKK